MQNNMINIMINQEVSQKTGEKESALSWVNSEIGREQKIIERNISIWRKKQIVSQGLVLGHFVCITDFFEGTKSWVNAFADITKLMNRVNSLCRCCQAYKQSK